MRAATKATIRMPNIHGRRLTERRSPTLIETCLLPLIVSVLLLNGGNLLVSAQESVTVSPLIVCMTNSDCGPGHRCVLPSLATPESATGHCESLNFGLMHTENIPTEAEVASTTTNLSSSPIVSYIHSLPSASSEHDHTLDSSPTVEHSYAAHEPVHFSNAGSETNAVTELPTISFKRADPLSEASSSPDETSVLASGNDAHTSFAGPKEIESAALLNNAESSSTLLPTTTTTTTTSTTTTTTLPPASSCKDRPCRNRGRCTDNVNGTYTCNCKDGYYGNRCQFTHCGRCDHGRCLAEETEDEEGNFVTQFRCYCRPGFSGKSCEEDVNECLHQSCGNGTCVNMPGSYRCDCPSGFEGTHCEHEIDECTPISPCQNGANCTNLIGSYRCDCPAGYEGKNCEKNINECAEHPCINNGVCVDQIASFRCECPSGFEGARCEHNIDDCTDVHCEQGARCEDLVNDFKCHCPKGFKGKRCELQVNECESRPCKNDGICVQKSGFPSTRLDETELGMVASEHNHSSTISHAATDEDQLGYFCRCSDGFEGTHCEINIDDCKNVSCQNNGTCVDGIGGFHCVCNAGFNGDHCEANVDDCNPNPCENNGKCIDLVNDYRCVCSGTGFEGRNCSKNIDECKENPCTNGGHCVDLKPFFRCECSSGYQGELCEHDVPDCESQPCHNDGVCYERSQKDLYTTNNPDSPFYGQEFNHANASGYYCRCPPGITGANCDFNINECQNVNCNHGECKDGINRYRCVCNEGYTGEHCEYEIDDCEPNPCDNAGICNDRLLGFNCHCPPLVFGDTCQHRFTGCDLDPCMNNGTCRPNPATGNQTAMCDCAPGFQGDFCEQSTQTPVDWLWVTVISCTCLLVSLLSFTCLLLRRVKRARATRGTYSPSTQEMFGNSASEILKPPPVERLI